MPVLLCVSELERHTFSESNHITPRCSGYSQHVNPRWFRQQRLPSQDLGKACPLRLQPL